MSIMRIVLMFVFTLAVTTVLAFECSVTCPKGFIGGCVKSDGGCACSCRPQAAQVKDDILKSLINQGASDDVLKRAGSLLTPPPEKLSGSTLRDQGTGRVFVITVNKQT